VAGRCPVADPGSGRSVALCWVGKRTHTAAVAGQAVTSAGVRWVLARRVVRLGPLDAELKGRRRLRQTPTSQAGLPTASGLRGVAKPAGDVALASASAEQLAAWRRRYS
jgi:hypothetical protein